MRRKYAGFREFKTAYDTQDVRVGELLKVSNQGKFVISEHSEYRGRPVYYLMDRRGESHNARNILRGNNWRVVKH